MFYTSFYPKSERKILKVHVDKFGLSYMVKLHLSQQHQDLLPLTIYGPHSPTRPPHPAFIVGGGGGGVRKDVSFAKPHPLRVTLSWFRTPAHRNHIPLTTPSETTVPSLGLLHPTTISSATSPIH